MRMDKEQAKSKVIELVADYIESYHKIPDFKPGDKIPFAARVYDEKEVVSLIDSALEFWLTAGRFTKEFEEKLAEFLDVRYCSFVNSGSSANLLAFMALTSPLLGERAIKRGDEVITVAMGFPTTISPVLQYGAVPVFIDVTIPQYNADISQFEQALSPKTKAVMLAHTLGNPFDLGYIKKFCKEHGLWLIEDNCDALGSMYEIDGKMRYTGTIGDIGTSSFYPAHHITTGEGGAVYTNDPLLKKIIVSMRDWGRDCVCPPGQDNSCGRRFAGHFGELPVGYDHKYVYSHLGYNLKATDLQAAIGVRQLEKLPGFIKKRRKNFDRLKTKLQPAQDKGLIILPEEAPDSMASWFGFLLTCGEGVSRSDVVAVLEKRGIQTRMLFAGNITLQPCLKHLQNGVDYRIAANLTSTDRVMNDSFWVGVYPGLSGDMIDYMTNSIMEALM